MGLLKGLIGGLLTVLATLTQPQTNGKSVWGTLDVPLLPPFLTNNPMPHGFPWGLCTANNTNYYKKWPNTGVIRSYDFTISRGVIAPDGYERSVLLVNGAYPGPLIQANWGDTIQVTVRNNITEDPEGTAIHWHGFRQQGTPWQDGVPAVGQCPITPGKTFTYSFVASLYGTTWYHSHYSGQYAGGLYGPMVIYGPANAKYDVDVGPILLNDWYHGDYHDLVEEVLRVNGTGRVFSDNNLINGKGNFDCSTKAPGDNTKCTDAAGISKFKFITGKKHRLRLVNSGAEGTQRFSIDGHTMTVIANDFVEVQPYDTKVVTLGIGQRTDVIVKADAGNSQSAFWIRSNMTTCSLTNQPYAVAAVYYEKADTKKAPTSKPWDIPDPGTCANDDLALTKPFYPMKLPNPDVTRTTEIKVFRNESGVVLWSFDGEDFRGNYNSPTLLLANLGNTSYPAEWNVRNMGTSNSIRVVVVNNSPAPHPMHLHGFNMYILHEGPGLTWDGTIVNPENPQRRDVQQVRAFGHMVMQFDSDDNPGMWPFHCHIAWHASAGFFLQFLVQPDRVARQSVPSTIAQTCRDWAEWTKTNIPDQIDSGL